MSSPTSVSERRVAIDELDRAIVNLAAKINAATYEWLVLIRQFDERAGWLKWSFTNCTQWLHWRCDLSLSAAREKIRIAHALKGLPEMSDAFARGRLSYSKVRALTRVATTVNEATLLRFALTTTGRGWKSAAGSCAMWRRTRWKRRIASIGSARLRRGAIRTEGL